MLDIGRRPGALDAAIGGPQRQIDGALAIIEFVRRQGQRVQHRRHGHALGAVGGGGQVLALLDQRPRQRVGEDAGGQGKGDGRAQRLVAGAVARFQPRIDQEPGIGTGGEVDIGRLVESLAAAIQRHGDGGRAGTVVRHQDHRDAGDAVIVRALEMEIHRIALGAPGQADKGDLRRRIGNGMDAPVGDQVSAGAHPDRRVVADGRGAGIVAITALEGPDGIETGGKSRRMGGAMDAQIQDRTGGHRNGAVARRHRRQRQSGIGGRFDPGIDGGDIAAVEGAGQAVANIAARHHQCGHQHDQQIPAQALRIAGAQIGHGGRDPQRAELCHPGAMGVPQRGGEGIARLRQDVVALRDRAVDQAAVAFQSPGAVKAAGPGEMLQPAHQRQRHGGDGGGQQQRLRFPGNIFEQAEQGGGEIQAGETEGGPQRRQQALKTDGGARPDNMTRDAAILWISRASREVCPVR